MIWLIGLFAVLSCVASQQLDSRNTGSAAGNSFEFPVLTDPSFVFNPPLSTNQPWTWTGSGGGISRAGGIYDAPYLNTAPLGTQFAFLTTLQGRQTSDMYTTLNNLVAGQRYSVTFTWGLRGTINGLPGYQTRSQLNVSIDGINVFSTNQNLTDDFGFADPVTSRSFTASSTTANLRFSVISLSTQEHTVLIDAVEIGTGLPSNIYMNVLDMASFEGIFPLNTNGAAYQYNPPVTVLQTWTFTTGIGGIAGIGSPWESGPTRYSPSGNQFAYLQTGNQGRRVANMSTHLTGLITGETYRIRGYISTRWQSGTMTSTNSRLMGYYNDRLIYQSIDNINGENGWFPFSNTFVATAMNAPLVFSCVATSDLDRAILIDSLVVEPINYIDQSIGRLSVSLIGHDRANSFESPALTGFGLGPGVSIQPFVYNPRLSFAQPWSFSPRLGGISRFSSPFDALGSIPDGFQYAFVQCSPSQSINQRNSSMWTLVTGLVSGTAYSVSFNWAIRNDGTGGYGAGITFSQITVTFGGQEIYRSSFNLSDSDGWQNSRVQTQPYTATSTTAELKFEVRSLEDLDRTFLFDAIDIGDPRPLDDFLNVGETADFASPFPITTVVWNPPQTVLQQWVWTPAQYGGIASGIAFDAPRPPSPNQFAVLKTSTGQSTTRMSTVLQGIIVGQTYRVTFWMANRFVGASQEYLKINGVTIWQSGTSFNSETAGFIFFGVNYVATSQSADFVFETVSSTTNEQYVFIDAVLVLPLISPRSGTLNSLLAGAAPPNSFEFPMLEAAGFGVGLTLEPYQYNPPLSPLCPWTFTMSQGGIAFTGSPYRSAEPSAPPAGDQWAFLMTSPGNAPNKRNATLQTTLSNLVPQQSYVLTFSWGLRYTNTPRTNARFTIWVNQLRVFVSQSDLVDVDGVGWSQQETSSTFVAQGTTAVLIIAVTSTTDTETTVLIDAVAVAPPPPRSGNFTVGTEVGFFESPCCAGYYYNPGVTALQPWEWTPVSAGGVARKSSPFDPEGNPEPPSVHGYAFLQTTSGRQVSNMSSTVFGLIVGQQYRLEFFLSARWNAGVGATSRQQLFVYVGDQLVFTSRPDYAAPTGLASRWEKFTTTFTARSSSSPLVFNVIAGDLTDRSMLVDSVVVQPLNFVAPGTLNVNNPGSNSANSFESPILDGDFYGTTRQSYYYNPMKTLTQPWEWTLGRGGIAMLNSPFDPPAPKTPPAGKQYAWLQTSPNHVIGMRETSMWTTLVNMVVGQQYSVLFTYGLRAAGVQGDPTGLITQSRLYVRVNNEEVFSTPNDIRDDAGWTASIQSRPFTAQSTTAVLNFTVISAADRDRTVLIDAVEVAPPLPALGTFAVGTLGGFEAPLVTDSFVADPSVNVLQPWGFSPRQRGSVAVSGAGFDPIGPNSQPPSASQFAMLRLNTEMSPDQQAANMSTILSGMITGQSYNLSFYMAIGLATNTLVMQSQERVYLGDRVIWSNAASLTNPQTWTPYTATFTAPSTAATLTFSTVSTTTNERTILIDSVRVLQSSYVAPTGQFRALEPKTTNQASFESPSLVGSTYGAGVTLQDYIFNPLVTNDQPWTFSNGGIAHMDSKYQTTSPRQPPHGSQFAILVTTETARVATMSTTITNLVIGTAYQVEFEWGVTLTATSTRSQITVRNGFGFAPNNIIFRSTENLSDLYGGFGNPVITLPFTASSNTSLLTFSMDSLGGAGDVLLIDAVAVTLATARSSSTGGPTPRSSTAPQTSTGSQSSPTGSNSSSSGGIVGDTSSSSSSLGGGAIAGIVIGVLAGVALLVGGMCFICFGGSRGQKFSKHQDEVAREESTTGEPAETNEDGVEMA